MDPTFKVSLYHKNARMQSNVGHSSSKLSLSTDKSDRHESKDNHGRDAPGPKRFGSMSSSKNNPFNTVAPLSTHAVSSPTAGGSSAFGLGSGAFASFGSATKTPKTPGTAFDFARSNPSTPTGAPSQEKKELEKEDKRSVPKKSIANLRPTSSPATEQQTGAVKGAEVQFPLKYTWVIWYRPPTSKNSDYEKSTKAMCKMGSVQQFWAVYAHLKHPSALPTVSDYHFFKEGIRPVWEDEENKKGGKWIMRLKKGVADRYWEELLMAMVGDQFAEAGEEVCGAVVSVRPGEDVFSIWTKNDGGRNVKIR